MLQFMFMTTHSDILSCSGIFLSSFHQILLVIIFSFPRDDQKSIYIAFETSQSGRLRLPKVSFCSTSTLIKSQISATSFSASLFTSQYSLSHLTFLLFYFSFLHGMSGAEVRTFMILYGTRENKSSLVCSSSCLHKLNPQPHDRKPHSLMNPIC